jgi:very-short-patch-repair endonuclease
MGHDREQSAPRGSRSRPESGWWALVERQHGVVTRAQLVAAGLSTSGIDHRIETGRLHTLSHGVYAVGRPLLTRHGQRMAAVLACGPHAVLSHGSAAALWEIGAERPGTIEVSVLTGTQRRREGVVVHRRAALATREVTVHGGIPLTAPIRTLVDIACRLGRRKLEGAIKEADVRGLCDPEALRTALEDIRGQRGVGRLRSLLDRRTLVLTDTELERRFLPIARRAGLQPPQTQRRVNGFRVDFFWPELGLVVETDGLRYHRTPAQQAEDRVRDQAHTAAGLTPLRFTHGQVSYEARHVENTLRSVVRRQRHANPRR